MMWLRRRRKPDEQPRSEGARRIEEARRARKATEQGLAEVRERRREVRQIAASLQQHRERNGFAEMFAQALRGAS